MVWVPEPFHDIAERLIARALAPLLHRMESRIMSALTDLKAAITDLSAQLDANNAEIDKLLDKLANPPPGGTSDADVQAVVSQIRDLITKNKTEVDKATQAVP